MEQIVIGERYYVKIWLKTIHQYHYKENLTLSQAQDECDKQKRRGRTPRIYKHKK